MAAGAFAQKLAKRRKRKSGEIFTRSTTQPTTDSWSIQAFYTISMQGGMAVGLAGSASLGEGGGSMLDCNGTVWLAEPASPTELRRRPPLKINLIAAQMRDLLQS
jgi:hypothetical protein